MKKPLTEEEVAILIRGRQILKQRGLSRDVDVTAICEAAGIARKTGYQWARKQAYRSTEGELQQQQHEFTHLMAEHEQLKKQYNDVRFENEGRKLAWKIHGVDGLLAASKKNTAKRCRKRKR